MAAIADLTEAEKCLVALMQDQSGIDLAEFVWTDETAKDNIFRCWDFQYPLYRNESKYQIDLCGRSLGKSNGIQMRAFAFPFTSAGEEMLITAPEMIHLDPVTKKIEDRITSVRIGREYLKTGAGITGFTHRPFEARFRNGARVIGRIPQKDGKGVKGMHPKKLEMDECFAAGTLILTSRGQVPIEEVVVGDEVFTHRNRWRRVTAVATRKRSTVTLEGQGHPGLRCSTNHKFWVRQVTGRGDKRRDGHQGKLFGPAGFVAASELATGEAERGDNKLRTGVHYWSTPTEFPDSKLPDLPDGVVINDDFWWLVGLYLAEGNCSARVLCWSIATKEVDEVTTVMSRAGIGWRCNDVAHGDGKRLYLVGNTALRNWLVAQCGRRTGTDMQAPTWLLGQPEYVRAAVLAGYVYGDGNFTTDARYAPGRWQATSVNWALVVSLKLLAQTLGYSVTVYRDDLTHLPDSVIAAGTPKERVIRRGIQYQIKGAAKSYTITQHGQRFAAVKKVVPTGQVEVLYDLTVEDDHSFVADSVTCSNSQDYPEPGWVELGETLKYADDDATWRAHGVSRGVRDRYYKQTQPESGWFVHRYTAMHRSDWSPEERKAKAELYGSRDHPDYRRNILGLHGDAASALFVLTRLMLCVDQDQNSNYNAIEYTHIRINDDKLRDTGMPIDAMLDFPASHQTYGRVWCGVDIGMTNHPSEIIILGEDVRQSSGGKRADGVPDMRLRTLARIHLERISARDQRIVMSKVCDFYRPKALSMDKTGIGLPIWSEIMEGDDPLLALAMRGYNFSEKIPVGYEAMDEDAPYDPDNPDGEPIMANVLEYSSDMLRKVVDQRQLILPWDIDMLREFQGQTYVITKSSTDHYGKKQFNKGKFHALDGFRMAILGYMQEHIDAMRALSAHTFEPVFDEFLL